MVQTVLGPVREQDLGRVLPHEHVLVGFIPDGALTKDDYDTEEVIRVMLPYLQAVKAQGFGTIAECTPAFLGRDAQLLVELSKQSGLHILTNTGYYQAPYLAPFVYEQTAQELADIWIEEAKSGIDDSGIKPGFIKIALSNGGPLPDIQRSILQAAMITSQATGLAIQAHTIGGQAAIEAVGMMQQAGFDLGRFIWVHADSEGDLSILRRVAQAGAWLSVDSIGWRPLSEHVEIVMRLIEKGFEKQLLLSHDAGWYHLGEPGGGEVKPLTVLWDSFVPMLKERGMSDETIDQLTIHNPAAALAVLARA